MSEEKSTTHQSSSFAEILLLHVLPHSGLSPQSNRKLIAWPAVSIKKTRDLNELLTCARDMATLILLSSCQLINMDI